MRWRFLRLAVENMREWVRVLPAVGFAVNLFIILAAISLIVLVDSYIVAGIAVVFGLAATVDIARWGLGVAT